MSDSQQPPPPGSAATPAGAPVGGVPSEALLAVDERLAALRAERAALLADRDARLAQLDAEERHVLQLRLTLLPPPPGVGPPTLLSTLPPPPSGAGAGDARTFPPPPPGGGPVPSSEWGPRALRNTLLAVGAVLLGLAALIFAVVAWPRLGDGGRGLLLGAVTVLVGGLTMVVARRLPATAEALLGLFGALLLVDWFALRRVGVGTTLDLDVWWVLGLSSVAIVGAAAGEALGLRAGRLGAVLLAGAAVSLSALLPGTLVAAAVVPALAAGVAATGARSLWSALRWRPASVALTSVAWALGAQALVTTAVLAVDRGAGTTVALVMGTWVVLPVVTRWVWNRSLGEPVASALVAATVAIGVGAVLVAIAPEVEPAWSGLVAVGLAAVVVTAARFSPTWARPGLVAAGGAVGVLALLAASEAVVTVGSAPWAMTTAPWTTDPWLAFEANSPSSTSFGGLAYGPLGVEAAPVGFSLLVAAAALAAMGTLRLPGRPVVSTRLGSPLGLLGAAGATLLLVVAAGASFVVLALAAVVVAGVLALALSTLRDRLGDDWWLVSCVGPLLFAVGLSLAAPGLALAVAAAVAVGAGAFAALDRPRRWLFAIAGGPAVLAAAPLVALVLADADVDRARPAVLVAGVVGGCVALVVAAVDPRLDDRLRVVVGVWGAVGIGAAGTLSATVWAQDRWSVAVAVSAVAVAAMGVAWRGRDDGIALPALGAAPVLVAVAAGLATLAGRWSPEVALVSVAGVGAVALAAGPHRWHGVRRTVVATSGGLTVMVAAGLLAEGAFPWPGDGTHALAVVLTFATASLGVAGVVPGWRLLEGAAAAVAVLATWTWLGLAEVSVVEAYTLPAAVVGGCAGWWQRRRAPSTSSWLAYGPALVLALGPSLVLSLDGDGGRSVAVALACLVALVVGAEGRLQAPLALGSFGLVVLALDTVGPVAAQVPRWMVLALAGLVSLWLGATIERRLGQARSWFDRFGHLR